ncbi:MAG: ABC transporter permease [Thermomicrobiales bacterium]
MVGFIARRLAQGAVLLALLSFVVFLMVYLAPGDAADFAINQRANEEEIQRFRHEMGLDLPWYRQYTHLAGNWVRLRFGTSIIQRKPVATIIKQQLPRTAEILALSILFSLLLAVPIGIVSAIRQYSLIDNVVTVLSFVGIAFPSFFLALMLILLFAVRLHWLPTQGAQTIGQPASLADHLKHLILPVLTLTLIRTAGWSRYIRSSMLEVLRQDYIRTAHAKGLTARAVLARHAFRNALMPLITLLGLSLPDLVAGAIVTEQIFSWNGLGQLIVTSAGKRDTPVVLALTLMSGAAIIIGNLLADIGYHVVDPRIQMS